MPFKNNVLMIIPSPNNEYVLALSSISPRYNDYVPYKLTKHGRDRT